MYVYVRVSDLPCFLKITLHMVCIVLQSISPGVVDTEIFETFIPSEMLEEFKSSNPSLKSEDISQAVLYVLGTPEHVQVTIMLFNV